MKSETKALKKHLQSIYPENNFRINYIQAHNQCDSADAIRIQTDVPYDELVKSLIHVVKNIRIYRIGESACSFWSNTPLIFDIETDAEFIEIDDVWTQRKRRRKIRLREAKEFK